MMNPFDTTGFPPRWQCGPAWEEQPWVGWLHIGADLLIFLAYFAVPVVVLYFVRQRDDLNFPPIFYVFLSLIFLSCGTVHLVEAG
ncbi:MAG: signal transduction histidine kinase, partial [Akkermansiaceae bacterium]|nr:signal transduction histidine kinase [Akkermansiaceae bacterium]